MQPTQPTAAAKLVNLQRVPQLARRLIALVIFSIFILAALLTAYSMLRLLESSAARKLDPAAPVTTVLDELATSVQRLAEAGLAMDSTRTSAASRWISNDPRTVMEFGNALRNWQAFAEHDLAIEIHLAKRLQQLLLSVAAALGVDPVAGTEPVSPQFEPHVALMQLDDLLSAVLVAHLRETRRVHAQELQEIHTATRRFVILAGGALLAFCALAVAYLVQARRYHDYLDRMGSLAEVIDTLSGVPLYEAMASAVGRLFHVDYVYIGRLHDDGAPRIETLAFYAHGTLAGNHTFNLIGTPCENITSGSACIHARGVQQLYPGDHWLRELAVEGFAGLPLRDGQGKVVGIVALLDSGPLEGVDLCSSLLRIVAARAQTEIECQRAEEAKQRMMQELEARVDARTSDLRRSNEKLSGEVAVRAEIERELQQARAEAEKANRLKGEFLANASHEIRTHINGLLGMLSLLEDSQLHGEQVEFVNMAHMSGDVLLAFINDLLDYSKIEAGQLDLEEIDFDVQRLVGEVVELFAVRARTANLELGYQVEEGVARHYCGDAVRIRQVLSNMLDNALKFTERGHVRLRVALAGQDAGVSTLRFAVEDTGIGIDPSDRQRLFEPFSQADRSITRRFGGTGLGLAICAHLVRLLGGEIDAEGEPGRGTRFWFSVPLKAGRASPEAAAHDSRHAVLEGLRVLVVDDSAVSRTYLSSLLAAWEVHCESAVDGSQALELLRDAASRKTPFDLLVLDRMMPKMDGVELAGVIRSDPELAGTKLIMVTHYGSPFSDSEVARSGLDGFLTKPLSQSRLFDTMATVLGRDASRGQAVRPAEGGCRGEVLVVEDNRVNQRVAAGLLKKLGYRSDIAENGREALDKLARGCFDLVLMDCQMPVMDGYEAVAELRRSETGSARHLPVIAMTAHALGGEREKCLAAGMDDYMAKPVRSADLAQRLGFWCGRSRAEMAAQRDPGLPMPVASTAGETVPTLDGQAMTSLREIMGSGFDALLETYLVDSESRLEEMQQLLDGDHGLLARVAHTLKGSSANVGARRLALRCSDLHMAAATGGASGAALGELLQQLREEYESVREALAQWRVSA